AEATLEPSSVVCDEADSSLELSSQHEESLAIVPSAPSSSPRLESPALELSRPPARRERGGFEVQTNGGGVGSVMATRRLHLNPLIDDEAQPSVAMHAAIRELEVLGGFVGMVLFEDDEPQLAYRADHTMFDEEFITELGRGLIQGMLSVDALSAMRSMCLEIKEHLLMMRSMPGDARYVFMLVMDASTVQRETTEWLMTETLETLAIRRRLV
ncbi:MAG: hypothetical protein AAGI01_11995, partial [Myxococcota bacterium]